VSAAKFLARFVSACERSGVPYMIAESFASSHHGSPRTTQDIDLVVDPTFESLDALLRELAGDDVYLDADIAREEFKRRGQCNVIDLATAWKVDVIFRKARAFSRSELERRARTRILGVEVFIASAEDTILAKLEWAKLGEERQLRDVVGILEVRRDTLDRGYIERWLDVLQVRELWAKAESAADNIT